ncbi:MAG: hypothetical protein M1813_008216 [Trichoglossum hirsutum]|nr:MAG: hypothetical protein M1813_008216 [Trichoglossum hirsutum]
MTIAEPHPASSSVPSKVGDDKQPPSPPHGPVTAKLSFYNPPSDGSVPFNYVEKQPEGQPQRNYDDKVVEVKIDDIRGREAEFSLDEDAFEAIGGVEGGAVDWTDDEQVRQQYYPEVERLVLDRVPGAKKVVIFDHTIRRTAPGAARAPVTRVHVDQTPASALSRVHLHVPGEESSTLAAGRYRILNVWRPLNPPVHNPPLAFASGRSIDDADVVGIEHRYPDRVGETAGVSWRESQRWFYWSGMRDGERLFLKCFDSHRPRGRVPHSAFEDPRVAEGVPGRESIEVRTLVFG